MVKFSSFMRTACRKLISLQSTSRRLELNPAAAFYFTQIRGRHTNFLMINFLPIPKISPSHFVCGLESVVLSLFGQPHPHHIQHIERRRKLYLSPQFWIYRSQSILVNIANLSAFYSFGLSIRPTSDATETSSAIATIKQTFQNPHFSPKNAYYYSSTVLL